MSNIQVFNSQQFGAVRTAENSVKDTYMGYIYACEYGDMVKIGSSQRPYQLLCSMIRGAEKYGKTKIGRFALSEPHTNIRENKKIIHQRFMPLRKDGTDLFDISMDDAINAIRDLTLKDETAQIQHSNKIFMDGMKNFVTGVTPTPIFEDKQQDIIAINNVHGYMDDRNNIWLSAEDVAIGFGFTQEKNSVTYIRWETVNAYLHDFGFSQRVGKGSYIPENMVYRLGFKANNQTAVKFQTILADEVLPSIRKHGAYVTTATIESIIADPDSGIKLLQALKESNAKAERERKERLAAQQQVEKLEHQAIEDKPKVIYADAVKGSTSSCLIGELAKMIAQNGYPIGEKRLFQWLRDNHYLCSYGERFNQPYQQYIEQGLFTMKQNVFSVNGEMRTRNTTKVTGKGQIYFINKFIGPSAAT